MREAVETYFRAMSEGHRIGAGTKETSYYPQLSNLLDAIGKDLKPRVRVVFQLRNTGAGIPDGGFYSSDQTSAIESQSPLDVMRPARGVLEIKPLSDDVEETARSNQVTKYVEHYDQVLVTNFRDFPAYVRAHVEEWKSQGKRVAMYDDPVARQVTDVLISATYERMLFDDYGYFEKMVRGQIDGMVYDCPLARHEMTTYGDKLRIAEDALNVSTYNIGVPAQDAALLADVNGVLKELGDQGLLATLEKRWLGSSAPVGDFTSATGKVVVVKRGETLSVIAKRELGNVEKWRTLYDANKDVVGPDPNQIYTGMLLRVPK